MINLEPAVEKWSAKPVSRLAEHPGSTCCLGARKWLAAMDLGFCRNRLHPPAWVRERFAWGPIRWPVYWCQAVQSDRLDCGAMAAVAAHIFESRGLTSLRVQLIEKYDVNNTDNWGARWSRENLESDWVLPGLVYHEAAGVLIDGRFQLFDPTDNVWRMPARGSKYGSALAIRIEENPQLPSGEVRWGWHMLPVGCWHILVDEFAPVREPVDVTSGDPDLIG